MTTENGTLESLARGLSASVAPLSNAFDSPEALRGFLETLGWQIPDGVTSVGIEPGRIETMILALQDVAGLDYDTANAGVIAEKYSALLVAVAALALHIYEVQSRIGAHLNAAYLAASNIASELPRRLLDYLIVEYLTETQPVASQALIVLGLIELVEIPRDDATFTSEHTRRMVYYDRLTKLVTDLDGLFRDVYSWGTPTADLKLFIERLYDLALLLGLPAAVTYPLYEKEVNLSSPAPIPQEGEAENPELRIPILGTGENAIAAEVGITLMPIAPAAVGQAPGLALCPYATGPVAASLPLDSQGRWILTLTSSLDLVLGIGLIFRPGQTLNILTDILGSASNASGNLSIDLRRQALSSERIPLLGTATGTGLTATTLYGKVGLLVGTGQETDFCVELVTEDGRLRLDFNAVDSFLSTLLPSEPLDLLFNLGVGWSSRRGLFFTGGAGLEYSTSVHTSLGPLNLETVHFGLKFKDADIRTFMAISGGAKLGPLAASVESIGLELVLSFPATGGNLGPANLAPTFKPPNGVGLAIDAAVVKGGGYLYFDFVKEEYAGVLELDLNGIVSVKAIGLITTKMPDGSKGFSLLLIITAEFGSPIQLGFGFTLSAVGGLLGLNRTMRLEVIATGIRDGGINSVMFPQNVVANAPRILSDLKKYFPVEEGTFLIGPMVKIGWGTPNLVTVSLGIIIEIPGNIAILGVLKVALPDKDAALIVIQVNFMGAIEFDKKRLWFFAALFDSRVLFITLEGQMGLLVGWGDDPTFVVSVGGFHPAFNPPPLPFGAITRIAISILNTDFARIRVEGYFAVTSNSVQFGAGVELYFGLSAFNIDGHLAFDALFRFSPFYFIISISASLSVKVFGIGLFSVRFCGSLEGPTPWHVEGTGSISLLFFDIDVDFSHTWGNEAETTLPPISVMPILLAEFQKLENWKAVLPANNQLLVSLRSFEQGATDLILHPVGSLKISQRAVPLGVTIDKLGNQRPSDANHFDVAVSTSGIAERGIIEESFAVGQYFAKSDNELLSAKSFQPIKSGMELAVEGEQYHAPQAVKRVVRYEKIIIDTNYRRFIRPCFTWIGTLFSLFLNGNAVSQSVLSSKQQKLRKPFANKVEIGKMLYGVAFNHDNTAFNAQAMNFTSQVQAEEYMKQQVAADAKLAKQLHVIPQVEMQEAA